MCRDKGGRIWVGGYNYMGYLQSDESGRLVLHSVTPRGDVPFHGQVDAIWQDPQGNLFFQTSDQSVYRVKESQLERAGAQPPDGEDVALGDGYEVSQMLTINAQLRAVATIGQGLLVVNGEGHVLFRLNEDNGLCNNNVNHIAYDGHGLLWGATDNGVFAISLPSIYSRYTHFEGLRGEVLDIQLLGDVLFAGTLNGLYRCVGPSFVPVAGIAHACWQMDPDGQSLLAATTGGIYRVYADGRVTQLTTASATAVLATADGFYSGELDGLFFYRGSLRSEVSDAEKVTHLYQEANGNVWAQNLYGDIWMKKAGDSEFRQLTIGEKKDEVNTLVFGQQEMLCVNLSGVWRWNGTQMVPADKKLAEVMPFPSVAYTDPDGNIWLTNSEGHGLNVIRQGRPVHEYDLYVSALHDYTVREIIRQKSQFWVGGDFGLIGIRQGGDDPMLSVKPRLLIRSVVIYGDSVVWGGMGEQPEVLPMFGSGVSDLQINYAIDYAPLLGQTVYRYRIDGGQWSAWSPRTYARFANAAPGRYTLEIEARDPMGRQTNTVTLRLSIQYPFYMRWYMLLLYLLLAGLLIGWLVRWRMRRLEQDKQRLEQVVQERTAEVVNHKDEIEQKSQSLQMALTELNETQHQLIRQEKMATVGKLTQGLIDRILNPLNYINNFSKLSLGLIKDVRANVEDEQEHMDAENYEDTMDVLDMLTQNLGKVEEHGINTTRTLKAMEELLKDRSGGMVAMNLVPMLQKNHEMLCQYYHQQIEEHAIRIGFDCPQTDISINGNAEQLSKTIMNLLGNAIYAVVKQAGQAGGNYQPEVRMSVTTEADVVHISIHDNGIGIEKTILGKIFDPFFTTKTTGEAAGVGLYLSHEIVQNHGGDITVTSEKHQFTNFIITIPWLH